jgi:hypothetical protein
MKNYGSLLKILFLAAFITISLIISTTESFAQLLPREEDGQKAQNNGAGLSSGLITLLPGRSIRVSAVNIGRKAVPLELVFVPVSEQGKVSVPIRCDAMPASGDAAFDKFTHTGGVNRMLMYVQIRVRQNANDIDDLVPSVEIFNEQTGEVEHILSGADFYSFRPIFNPPFAPEN